MTVQEKQTNYAQALYLRGLITEEQMKVIINAKFSYEIVETMLDLASGLVNKESARTMLMRMVR